MPSVRKCSGNTDSAKRVQSVSVLDNLSLEALRYRHRISPLETTISNYLLNMLYRQAVNAMPSEYLGGNTRAYRVIAVAKFPVSNVVKEGRQINDEEVYPLLFSDLPGELPDSMCMPPVVPARFKL
jgi:hypothetical protein